MTPLCKLPQHGLNHVVFTPQLLSLLIFSVTFHTSHCALAHSPLAVGFRRKVDGPKPKGMPEGKPAVRYAVPLRGRPGNGSAGAFA